MSTAAPAVAPGAGYNRHVAPPTTGLPEDDSHRRVVGAEEIHASRAQATACPPPDARHEPESPQRPRRTEPDVVLVACAMCVLGAFLVVAVAALEEVSGVGWLTQLANDSPRTFIYGLPGTAVVLLALSLAHRSRRPPTRS